MNLIRELINEVEKINLKPTIVKIEMNETTLNNFKLTFSNDNENIINNISYVKIYVNKNIETNYLKLFYSDNKIKIIKI